MCTECERVRDSLNVAMDALEGLMEDARACELCAHEKPSGGCKLVDKYGDNTCSPLWKGRASI